MATAPSSVDAVLVRRLRERDRSAWDEVYTEYGSRLRAFAYRLSGNSHDADDLVQETFVRALPRLDRLDPDTVAVGPYLFTTLRNLFLKSVARGARSAPVADVPEPRTAAPIEDDPERSTLLHAQQEEVRVANALLAPRQRLVLALRELEDRSYAEIGVIVGLSENAVAQLISRARESLRTELRLAQVDPERLPEQCRRFLPLLSRHLDGQLRGAQLEQTLAHLEHCERCQDALASMQEAQRRYRVLVPLVAGAEELLGRIDDALAAGGYWSGPPRATGRLRGRAAIVAACAAGVLFGAAGAGTAVLVTDDGPAAATAATASPVSAALPTTSVAATTSRSVPPLAPRPAPRPKTPRATGTTTVAAPPPRPKVLPPTTTTTSIASAAPTTAMPTTAPAKPVTPPPARTTVKAVRSTAPKVTKPPAMKPEPPPPMTTATAPATTTTTPAADTIAPTVDLFGRPPEQTTSGDASFAFRASERGSSFSCQLDAAGFAPCGSPVAHRGLAPGAHAFAVRATDLAGNTGPEATATWTVLPPPDTTAPIAVIVSASTTGSDATFEFSSSEAASAFWCSLDRGAFESCTSPRSFSGLQAGGHVFAVRATDAAGNTGAPATHAWTVAQPLPDLIVSSLTETIFTVTNVGTASAGPFVVSVTLIGTFSFAGLAPGESASRTWSACRIGTLTAIADRGVAVVESSEDNNSRSLVSDC